MWARPAVLQQLSRFVDWKWQRYRCLTMTGFFVIIVLADVSFAQVREIEVGCHAGDLKRYSWDDLGYSGSYLATAIDRKTAKRKTTFEMRIGPPDLESRFHLYFPLASEGDVVPMFGTTCQVGVIYANSHIVDVGVPDFGPADGTVKMTPIKLLDPNIKVLPNCLTIPHQGRAFRRDPKWQPRLKVIGVNYRGVKKQAEVNADLTVELKVLDRLEVPASHRVFIEGQEVFRDRERFVVKHIVLPDSQKHIMGWVSLEPMHEKWDKPPKPAEKK
ncbi:MAG: hypothetical protein FD138_2484 [Planctomycetota bacterium]|nr:MAG: hypothetical protein FD138_2484 [Planctomycetota bacterium]